MSRIEDGEAERAERLRQERKLQEQQTKTKQLAEDQQFLAHMRKAGETKKQTDAQDQQKNESNQSARQKLMAHRGIANNDRTSQMASDGAQSNQRTRQRQIQDAKGREHAGEPEVKPQTGGESNRSTRMGIKGGNSQGQDDGQSREEPKKSRGSGANSNQLANATFAAIGEAAVQALDGMGARTQASSAVDQVDKLRKMIDEIVAGVLQGRSEGGKNAYMEITLNGDTLGGARLVLLSTDAGIDLKIYTNEEGNRRSDRPVESLLLSSAKELSDAMKEANVKLLGLEVNGEKVIA